MVEAIGAMSVNKFLLLISILGYLLVSWVYRPSSIAEFIEQHKNDDAGEVMECGVCFDVNLHFLMLRYNADLRLIELEKYIDGKNSFNSTEQLIVGKFSASLSDDSWARLFALLIKRLDERGLSVGAFNGIGVTHYSTFWPDPWRDSEISYEAIRHDCQYPAHFRNFLLLEERQKKGMVGGSDFFAKLCRGGQSLVERVK